MYIIVLFVLLCKFFFKDVIVFVKVLYKFDCVDVIMWVVNVEFGILCLLYKIREWLKIFFLSLVGFLLVNI